MTDWKGIVKKGWHPEKEGTTLKGQVKGLIGRGGDNSSATSSGSHSATPITSLRDPSSFGPPPKRVGYGATAASPQTTGSTMQQHQSYQQPHSAQTYGVQSQTEEPVAESRPFKVNTTGLDTSHLPPPPVRRDSPERRDQAPPPPSYSMKPGGPPSLPPRLPPRSGNASPVRTQSPVSTGGSQGGGYLNQDAVTRLGAAGISVPGLGIGKAAPLPPARSPTTTTPTQGTTWAQKQAALKTASSFHKDPSSVSFADAKAAAGTAHSFQQRHGDQVASGLKTANGISQRFGGGGQKGGGGQGTSMSPIEHIAGIAGKKKPAPPPPSKKPQLSGAVNDGGAPPPVPMATRPNFN
ncbi:hypothetical protein GGR53DRAFT_469014 [Hypoxylon sp. FL1150]|nr:hypothetical protein GGR53DRAFT_469014 [Hypoxylon sp. FL1150]